MSDDQQHALEGGSSPPLLTCDGLVIGHRNRPLLPAIHFGVRPGTFLAVVGRNGSGKSTWLRTMLGLVRPVGGRLTRKPGLRLGYMPQVMTLDPLLPIRAADLVEWGRLDNWDFIGAGRRAANSAASIEALTATKATALGDTLFRDLSEGQKQRVLLARTIARGADVAFLDEPTAAMDAVAEATAMTCLKDLTRQRGMTVVVVSHLLGMVARFADQVLFFDREGGVTVAGTPAEIFAHPAFRSQYGELGIHHAH